MLESEIATSERNNDGPHMREFDSWTVSIYFDLEHASRMTMMTLAFPDYDGEIRDDLPTNLDHVTKWVTVKAEDEDSHRSGLQMFSRRSSTNYSTSGGMQTPPSVVNAGHEPVPDVMSFEELLNSPTPSEPSVYPRLP
jgi:hypothetical protein